MAIQTRWMDNDIYGHVNNVVYYSYFDTVIGHYLIERGGLEPLQGASSAWRSRRLPFHRSLAFPDIVHAGLRVGKLGPSSVRYEIGIFRNDEAPPAPTGTSSTSSSTGRPSARCPFRNRSGQRSSPAID